jgi:hypothetical protein
MKEKIYIENVIDILRDFADKKHQVRVWMNVNNIDNLVGSFDEAATH